MNYDDMPAGRELDALVAEKVMGQETTEWTDGLGGTGVTFFAPVEPYSTDIAAAWEVAEKLIQTLGIAVEQPFHDGIWRCTIFGLWPKKWVCHGETAPLAICRAALKAVEGGDAT